MIKEVVLTSIAEDDLENILDYLQSNWGQAVCSRFVLRFEEVCRLFSTSPEIYPQINRAKKIRKCTLTSQNTIYFRVKSNTVEIITIFDNRQDPAKLQTILQ
jgi:plasmid stabilization system protein ParE